MRIDHPWTVSYLSVTIRRSDFNIYGHVNHAVYVDTINIARAKSRGNHIWLGKVTLTFFKQISRPIEPINVQVNQRQGGGDG
jgi:acyl-ACP thioesterase